MNKKLARIFHQETPREGGKWHGYKARDKNGQGAY